MTDSIGRVHLATYDLADRVLTATEDSAGLSITTTYGYDDDDLLKLLTDADGYATSWTYDGKGRRTRVDYEQGLFEAYTYDLADRTVTHRTQDGVVTVFSYDDDDTLAARTAGALRDEYDWNALDQLTRAESFQGGVSESLLTFVYDGFSRLETEEQDAYDVGYAYDASHNRTTVTYPTGAGGPTLTYAFDAIERIESITDPAATFADYDYVGPARLDSCTTGPTTTSVTWDGLRRATRLDSGLVHDVQYAYDDLHRREYKQSHHSPLSGAGDVYAYDGGSRLSDVWYDAPAPASGGSGAASHLEIQQTKVQSRTATIVDGGTPTTWVPDSLHQTTSIVGVARSYDAKGNLTSDGTLGFGYDTWNRLTSVSDASGTLVTYELRPARA